MSLNSSDIKHLKIYKYTVILKMCITIYIETSALFQFLHQYMSLFSRFQPSTKLQISFISEYS
jgi:hypothetical protein